MIKRKITFIILTFLFLMLASVVSLNAFIKTGHDEFQEIIFDDENVVLLVNMNKDEISKEYNRLNRKAFGWTTHYFNMNEHAEYVGNTLFSRSNRTGETIKISYKLTEEAFNSTVLKVSGGVDLKVTAQNKKKTITGTVNPSFSIGNTKTNSQSKEEVTEFKMDIAPYTRVSLRITGECYVTTAISKYFFFGIPLKKGEWERIDVETMYYELYEESIAR